MQEKSCSQTTAPRKTFGQNKEFATSKLAVEGVTSGTSFKEQSLIAWCTIEPNTITIFDIQDQKERYSFNGIKLTKDKGEACKWTHVKHIPATNLLVSISHQYYDRVSNFEVTNLSDRGPVTTFSFEEVVGETSFGDFTYNSRRQMMALLPVTRETGYHLFQIDNDGNTSLLKKSKWNPKHTGRIPSFDIDNEGRNIASLDDKAVLVLSSLDSQNSTIYHDFETPRFGDSHRCRWHSTSTTPVLYVKYEGSKLNALDAEKQTPINKTPAKFKEADSLWWIDVCQPNGNLVASAWMKYVQIYDHRSGKMTRTIGNKLHEGSIFCVSWSLDGKMIATAASEGIVKVLDFGTGKTIASFEGKDPNQAIFSACFI